MRNTRHRVRKNAFAATHALALTGTVESRTHALRLATMHKDKLFLHRLYMYTQDALITYQCGDDNCAICTTSPAVGARVAPGDLPPTVFSTHFFADGHFMRIGWGGRQSFRREAHTLDAVEL